MKNINCKHPKPEIEEENQCSSDQGEPERNRRGVASIEDDANRFRREVGRAAAVYSSNPNTGLLFSSGGLL